MATKYFKHFSNGSPVVVAGGSVTFTKVDRYSEVLATDNEGLQREFETMMRQDRGGITEISEAEYQELKKNPNFNPSNPAWREELGAKSFVNPVPAAIAQSVSMLVAESKVQQPVIEVPTSVVPKVQEFKPPVTKRTSKKASL